MSDGNKKLDQIKKADSLFSKKRLQEIENTISEEDKKEYLFNKENIDKEFA